MLRRYRSDTSVFSDNVVLVCEVFQISRQWEDEGLRSIKALPIEQIRVKNPQAGFLHLSPDQALPCLSLQKEKLLFLDSVLLEEALLY